MVKPMAMNHVMADPSKRPRTPNDAPLDTWLFVPVFGLTGVTARKMNEPDDRSDGDGGERRPPAQAERDRRAHRTACSRNRIAARRTR